MNEEWVADKDLAREVGEILVDALEAKDTECVLECIGTLIFAGEQVQIHACLANLITSDLEHDLIAGIEDAGVIASILMLAGGEHIGADWPLLAVALSKTDLPANDDRWACPEYRWRLSATNTS